MPHAPSALASKRSNAMNATDRQYEPARDYQPIGRQAWIGVRYDSTGL